MFDFINILFELPCIEEIGIIKVKEGFKLTMIYTNATSERKFYRTVVSRELLLKADAKSIVNIIASNLN